MSFKQGKDCCYKCGEKPYEYVMCKVVILEKDKNDHMSKHYDEASFN